MAQNANAATAADEELNVGRRAAQRARLHVHARLQTISREVRVVLRNLSCTGAMLEGDDLPPSGRTVVLKRGPIDVMGQVVWTAGGRCGLEFFEPLNHDEVIRESRHSPEQREERKVPYYWRSARNEEGLSVEEWSAAKDLALRSRH